MSEEIIDIEVHYVLHLPKSLFKKAIELAESQGCDHSDAGKIETVRRLLISDGVFQGLPEEDFGLLAFTRKGTR